MRANRVMSMFGTSENALKHVSSILSSSAVVTPSSECVSSAGIVATLEAFLTEATTGVDSTGFGIELASSHIWNGADSIFSCREGVRSSVIVVMSSTETLFVDVSPTGNSVTNGELGPSSQFVSSVALLTTAGFVGVILSWAISSRSERE